LLPKLTALPTHDIHDDAAKEPYDILDSQSHKSSARFLMVITGSATAILVAYAVPATIVLGLSSAIFAAAGLVLLEKAIRGMADDDTSAIHEAVSNADVQTGRKPSIRPSQGLQLAVLRDAAATLTIICTLASLLIEPSVYGIYRQPASRKHQQHWTRGHDSIVLQQIIWMVPVNIINNALMYFIVSSLSLYLPSSLSIIWPRVLLLHSDH
jgi:hypothetical protein